jgi:hypothetical protein
MQTHVRVYTVQPGMLDAFVEEWRAAVVPLRRRFGFEVAHAWASLEDETFVWVVTYDGEDWDAAEQAYYDSPDRRAIDPDPARHIQTPRDFAAKPVPLP